MESVILANYNELPLIDLRNELKKKGLSIIGKKEDLIQRLQESSSKKIENNDIIIEAASERESEETETPVHTINFNEMVVSELKTELKQRGLPLSGKRNDLIQRLQDSPLKEEYSKKRKIDDVLDQPLKKSLIIREGKIYDREGNAKQPPKLQSVGTTRSLKMLTKNC